MSICVWGNGAPSDQITRLANASCIVCDDYVPYPRQRWKRRYYQRISTVNYPLDSSLLAQTIREANRLKAVDELVFPLTDGQISNLESAIYAIGVNDLFPDIQNGVINREWSEIVFAVAGDVNHLTATRFFNAVNGRNAQLGNRPHQVKIAWEAYHTCGVWGYDPNFLQMYNDLRAIDRNMLARISQFGLAEDSWFLGTATDNEKYADMYSAPHYAACSYDPDSVKPIADEDSFYEALLAGVPVIGAWMPSNYTTEDSRAEITDSIRRAVRRKSPSGPRDSG